MSCGTHMLFGSLLCLSPTMVFATPIVLARSSGGLTLQKPVGVTSGGTTGVGAPGPRVSFVPRATTNPAPIPQKSGSIPQTSGAATVVNGDTTFQPQSLTIAYTSAGSAAPFTYVFGSNRGSTPGTQLVADRATGSNAATLPAPSGADNGGAASQSQVKPPATIPPGSPNGDALSSTPASTIPKVGSSDDGRPTTVPDATLLPALTFAAPDDAAVPGSLVVGGANAVGNPVTAASALSEQPICGALGEPACAALTATPEPASIALLASGLAALAYRRRAQATAALATATISR